MSSSSPIAVRVARKTTEALDICSLELVAVDGSALPAFSAGSHIDVQLPGGSIERVRCICYEYNRAWVGEAPVIASGDWMRDRHPDR